MKRAIILHCWGGNSDYAWYPYAKTELTKLGYEVTVPNFSDSDNPNLINWLKELQAIVVQPDDELILIGHSIGTVLMMRYLEAIDVKIDKAIMVSAFCDSLGFNELQNFFAEPFSRFIEFEKIKAKANQFVVIQSDNDPFVSANYGDRISTELDAQLIIKHDANHMSGATDGEESCLELPEVVESI